MVHATTKLCYIVGRAGLEFTYTFEYVFDGWNKKHFIASEERLGIHTEDAEVDKDKRNAKRSW